MQTTYPQLMTTAEVVQERMASNRTLIDEHDLFDVGGIIYQAFSIQPDSDDSNGWILIPAEHLDQRMPDGSEPQTLELFGGSLYRWTKLKVTDLKRVGRVPGSRPRFDEPAYADEHNEWVCAVVMSEREQATCVR